MLNADRFTAMIVSPSGDMTRMATVSPVAFARFKRWLAIQPTRDAMKRSRDAMQADVVERIVEEYFPQLLIRPEEV
ncbi:MAG: GSU2403 family nucleotidyltransferase fold protein [Thiobacillaceae bacterium]